MLRTLIKKEFLLVGRAKNGLASLLTLNLAFLFIFHFSMEKSEPLELERLLGFKWANVFLLSFVFIGQSLWEEREGGAYRINQFYLESYLYYLVKSLVIAFFLLFFEIILILLMSVFFPKFELSSPGMLFDHMKYLTGGILSLSFLGVTLGQMSQETRLKEIVLPILLIPFSLPIFLIGMGAERDFFLFRDSNWKSYLILYAFSVFYASLGSLVQEMGINE